MTITFIGGGNMATAIAGGQIARGRPAGDLAVVEPIEAQRAKLARRFPGMRVHAAAGADAIAGAEVVVLAVKPQHMREACRSIAAHIDRVGVVLSIAAGTRVRDIARWLGGCDRIVRAMPNTPALVGAGLSGLWAAPSVDARGRASAAAILEVCGEVLWVGREEALDASAERADGGARGLVRDDERLGDRRWDRGLGPSLRRREPRRIDGRRFDGGCFDGRLDR